MRKVIKRETKKRKTKSLVINTVRVLAAIELLLLFLCTSFIKTCVKDSFLRSSLYKLSVLTAVLFAVSGVGVILFLMIYELLKKEEDLIYQTPNDRFEKKYQDIYDEVHYKNPDHKYRYSTEQEATAHKKANTSDTTQTRTFTGLFEGLNEQEASKKYKSLIKKYHPDNGGSVEMTEYIMEEYKKYKKGYSKK